MLRIDEYSMNQLIDMKNDIIDEINTNYSDELDHDNDDTPSDRVRELLRDYKIVCNEISLRESRVRKFDRIISSGMTVKKYYQDMESFSQNFVAVSNDWYSAHHDYHDDLMWTNIGRQRTSI